MAFTLGFHIRAGLSGDPAALLLARRWSTVMAVTFAVGAVTGTVLSLEMGLLWPGLMGRYGGAFGIPFAVEGLFFFLEAIFIAIYIYGLATALAGAPSPIRGPGRTGGDRRHGLRGRGEKLDEPAVESYLRGSPGWTPTLPAVVGSSA